MVLDMNSILFKTQNPSMLHINNNVIEQEDLVEDLAAIVNETSKFEKKSLTKIEQTRYAFITTKKILTN